jgi:hypothetical protein
MSRASLLTIALLIAPLTAACDNGPAAPTATTAAIVVVSPVTETFATQLAVGGSSSRTFTAAKSGTATVTLTSLGSTLKVGLGIGIPDAVGGACLFTKSIETAAGGQLAASVDPGVYCVRVYDLGTLTSTINFTVTIVRP